MNEENFQQQLKNILQETDPKRAFYDLCDLYFVASSGQRDQIRADFDFNRSWEVPNPKTLAAHLSDEPDRERRIRSSLIALSLFEQPDWRDTLVSICVIYHSIKSVGKDADVWLKFFADLSSPQVASLLWSFAERKQEDKSLSAFGWHEEITDEGLVFTGW